MASKQRGKQGNQKLWRCAVGGCVWSVFGSVGCGAGGRARGRAGQRLPARSTMFKPPSNAAAAAGRRWSPAKQPEQARNAYLDASDGRSWPSQVAFHCLS